eukprot:gene27710-7354_t
MLTTRDDMELYLRTPEAFNIAIGESLTFAELAESTRCKMQTAIGYLNKDGCITMVPGPHEWHRFEEGDQIIVVSEHFTRFKQGKL